MESRSKDELIIWFDGFEKEFEKHNKYLLAIAQKNNIPLTLDQSVESLDGVESLYKDILDGKIKTHHQPQDIDLWVGSYLGNCLIKEFNGGSWYIELEEDYPNYGIPGIHKIPELDADYGWCPFIAMNIFRDERIQGLFRMAIQHHHELKNK